MTTTALVRRTQSKRVDFAFPMVGDRAGTYKIAAPLPMPSKLLWSVAICDALTGEELGLDREAAATTMFESKEERMTSSPKAHLGPIVSNGARPHGSKTIPGRGWFVYCRVCAVRGSTVDQHANRGVAGPANLRV